MRQTSLWVAVIMLFPLQSGSVTWKEIELSPSLSAQSRTQYGLLDYSLFTQNPQLRTQANLLYVDKAESYLQYLTLRGMLSAEHRWVQIKAEALEHLVLGGDIFSTNHLSLGETYLYVGNHFPLGLKFGRQRIQIGHELTLGFNEWSIPHNFTDGARVSFESEPWEAEFVLAKFFEKTALNFLTLREQILLQNYLATQPLNVDSDLLAFLFRYEPDKHQDQWIHAYGIPIYYNNSPFSPFDNIVDIRIVGLAYQWKPLSWFQWGGEAATQWGRYGSDKNFQAWFLYGKFTSLLTTGRWHFDPFVAAWFSPGNNPGHIFVRPDLHPHLGTADIFGFNNILAYQGGIKTSLVFSDQEQASATLSVEQFFIDNRAFPMRNTQGFIIMNPIPNHASSFLGTELNLLLAYTYDFLSVDILSAAFFQGPYAQDAYWIYATPTANPNHVSLYMVADLTLSF